MGIFYGCWGQATIQGQGLLQVPADILIEMAAVAVLQFPLLDILSYRPVKAKHLIIDLYRSPNLAGAISVCTYN